MISTNKRKFAKLCYGQVIIGPPGSGKSTYCYNMCKFLNSIDRKCIVVNLDPGNENMEYTAEIDVMKLITISDVMENYKLGPNGALIFCMEYLEQNFEWLRKQFENFTTKTYFLFDCPGQVELYTHHKSMSNIFGKFENLGYHLCVVNLIDSHYCSEPSKFISTLLLSLSTMLNMSLPHINILSKADILKQYESKLPFNIDFYTDVLDLHYLLNVMDDNSSAFNKKYAKLNSAIVSLVEDYGLVSFQLLDATSTKSLLNIKNIIDKANGYIYGASEESTQNTLMACAVGAETETERMAKNIEPYINI